MFSSLRANGPQGASTATKDEDPFTTILTTPALRVEFTLIVMLCTNVMRERMAATFDAAQTSSKASASQKPRMSQAASEQAKRNNKDQSQDLLGGDSDDLPPSYNTATSGRGRQDYDRRYEELSDPETRELRRAAIAYFNAWRTKVLRRVGEALNIRAESVLREKERREREGNLLDIDEKEQRRHPHYATIPTQLVEIEEQKRIILLDSLLLLLLSLETYSAHSRLLLAHIATSLNLPTTVLTAHENKIASGLLTAAEMSAEEETKRKAASNSAGRAWKVGLATVAGAALIGVTGGLAAPFLAAGLGTVFGAIGLGGTAAAGLLGGLAGNFVLIGGLFGAYGGKMTGKMMDAYAREISDFGFVPLRKVSSENHRLRVAIAISGWLTERLEVIKPWRVLSGDIEGFALRWELDLLLELGTGLTAVIKSYAWDLATSEIIKRTLFASIAAGLWPLGLIRVCQVAENPFSVAKTRADKAGDLLADALINKAQGERPVTLVGYSMGARLIYACLQSLASRRAFGIVESVVLIGAPCPSDAPDWRNIRSVVAGRVVNVYSANDFILGFLYRTSSIQFGVAGLEPIEDVAGVENFDVSELVSGHLRYRYLVGRVLQEIGFEEVDDAKVAKEAELLKQMDAEEEQARREKEAASKPRSGARPAYEDLISIGDDSDSGHLADARQSAHRLSDVDIQQRVANLDLRNQSTTQDHHRMDSSSNPPTLPPRPRPAQQPIPHEETSDTESIADRGIRMEDAEAEAEDLEAQVARHLQEEKEARKATAEQKKKAMAQGDAFGGGASAFSSKGKGKRAKMADEKEDDESDEEAMMMMLEPEPVTDSEDEGGHGHRHEQGRR